MNKNIVICCDGTGNDFSNLCQDSNVAKLYSTLTRDHRQIGYYHPGVGTLGDPTIHNRFGREWSRMKGLAFGKGLMANVGDAYRYLMDNYADGDRIYLFGFSRGAFTARVLASLIHVFGLLCAGNDGAIPYILEMFSQKAGKLRSKQPDEKSFQTEEGFKWQFSHSQPVKIYFAGLWDTVSSYGWINDPIQLPFLGNNPVIETGRHAISIHERRCFYQDNLWGEPPTGADGKPTQDIRQVWFSGVHSDVGGSYCEKDSGLSKITLEWMLVEAAENGLLIDVNKTEKVLGQAKDLFANQGLPDYVGPDENALLHVSLKGFWWWAAEYLPQHDPHEGKSGLYVPKGRMRTIPPDSLIHESVLRGKHKPNDLPTYRVEDWVRFHPSMCANVAAAT